MRNSTAMPSLGKEKNHAPYLSNNVSLPMIKNSMHPTRNSIDVFEAPTKTLGAIEKQQLTS